MQLYGRTEIKTGIKEITPANLVRVLNKAAITHAKNRAEIDYLYRYMRGEQPILNRKKDIRPEICNRVVENHAAEIVQFVSGYFLGEPVTYVRRGDRTGTSEDINLLNDCMFFENKSSHDKDLATWMAICGVGYRMVLPDKSADVEEDESPFELDTLDPRETFVVYHSGFGHRPLMAVREVWLEKSVDNYELHYCGYTETHYFNVVNGVIKEWTRHSLGGIPIFEYRQNMSMMGCFEPALPLLDAINNIMSNRVDGVEQYVQSFLKFINCDVESDTVDELRKMGAIVIKSANGLQSDVQIVSQELNQQQTQTLVDYLYDQVLTICGMPTTTKGGASTSDTGNAVFLRDGWATCVSRVNDTELLFKRSEKEFLRMVLRIIRETHEFNLSLAEVECKFTRRQYDNLLTKTQSLLQMLEGGVHPEIAFAQCGLFNDPMDAYARSAEYLRKWDYIPLAQPVEMDTTVVEEDGV